MILLVNKYFLANGFAGFACWPFIVVREKVLLQEQVFINHERIHLRQQVELLVLPFYLWYVMEFLIRFCACSNAHKAYRNISFEREAYTYEHDKIYLKRRKMWSFLRFL